MPAQSGGSFAGRALRAVLHPLPIAFAVVTVAAALISPILALPAAGLWIGSVVGIAALRGARKRGPDISHLSPSLQRDLLGVTTALDQLQDAAKAVPDEQKPMFESIEREAVDVRSSVLEFAVKAGALHRHLEATRPDAEQAPGDAERRERMLARLAQYHETLQSLETTARDLADRAVELAAGAPMRYDALDEQSPERKISEMKASMADIEEVMRAQLPLAIRWREATREAFLHYLSRGYVIREFLRGPVISSYLLAIPDKEAEPDPAKRNQE